MIGLYDDIVVTYETSLQLNDFIARFEAEGPGASNIDMDHGLTLIEPYGEKFDYLDSQRMDLSERMFNWINWNTWLIWIWNFIRIS